MALRASVNMALVFVLALGAVPAWAGNADAGLHETRVERLLWQLINDERYSHLPIAANYERLRARLLEHACFVSDAPCAASDRIHHGRVMTTEISPEQAEVLEQLLFTIHSASASVTETPSQLMISATE